MSVSRFCENCRYLFLSVLIVQSKQKAKTCTTIWFVYVAQTHSASAVLLFVIFKQQNSTKFWISWNALNNWYTQCSILYLFCNEFSHLFRWLLVWTIFVRFLFSWMQLPCATFHGTRPQSMPMMMMIPMMPLFKKKKFKTWASPLRRCMLISILC